MTPNIELVAAISRNGVIGQNGGIPWNIPEDLAHFRQLTYGHNILMGYNTWLSLPEPFRPLPGRTNIVLTSRGQEISDPSVKVISHVEDIPSALDPEKTTYIIGGSKTYELFLTTSWLPTPSKLHITHIDMVVKEGADTVKFYHPAGYKITSYSAKHWSETEQCHYQYITYELDEDIHTINNDSAYTSLVRDILRNGHERTDRTGTGTISVFGRQIRFNLDGTIPILTTKYVPWKSVIKELLWFLKGQTDASILKSQGVGIWDGNTSREFLDARGLDHLPEGDIGAGYGFQWRHYGGTYKTCKDIYDSTIGYDQVAAVVEQLRTDPYSRRIYMTAWNPGALHMMALPPCHVSAQFYVEEGSGAGADAGAGARPKLSCHMYQRSVDVFLGLPFNIMSYATLTYILAAMCDMTPHELVISTGDTHIYKDHLDQVQTQIRRGAYMEPVLVLSEVVKTKTVDELTIDDFDVVGYFHHGILKGKMSV